MSHSCLMRRGENMSKNKVSVSKAAKMVGVSRATFYRHIEEKSISTEQDNKGTKVIDVAELIRIYGDNLKTLEDVEKAKKERNKTTQDSSNTSTELELLKDRLKNIETERERERTQLTDQVEDLRTRLEKTEDQRIKSEEQKDRLTLMLTDQRFEKDKVIEKEKTQTQKFTELEKTIQELKLQQENLLSKKGESRGFFRGLFGT